MITGRAIKIIGVFSRAMLLAIRHWMIISAARLLAFLAGDRIILLTIEPRPGGYSMVRSPDLRGFAMLLQPGEINSTATLITALSAPLTAYLEAEDRRLTAVQSATSGGTIW